MRGISCIGCPYRNKPYLTAYEIAVKHGFEGSEEDWIKTMQSVYTAKVLGESGFEFTCSDNYADLIEKSKVSELHMITPEGMIAFCHGISTSKIVFQTMPFDDDDLGSVYKQYEITSANACTFLYRDAVSPGQNSVTKSMLSNAVQASLDKADSALQNIDDAVPRDKQIAKTATVNRKASIGSDGTLYYETPEIIYIPVVYDSGYYDIDTNSADLRGYSSVLDAIQHLCDVRLLLLGANTFETFLLANSPDPNQIVFASPQYDTYGSGTATIVYFIWDQTQPHLTRVVKTLS